MRQPNFKVTDGNGSLSFLRYDRALYAFLDLINMYDDGSIQIDKGLIQDCLVDNGSYGHIFGNYPDGLYTIVTIEKINDDFPLEGFNFDNSPTGL